MKYFVTIALTIGLIQLANCQDDYGDDASLHGSYVVEEEIEEVKPIYNIAEAPALFTKFVDKYRKKYKDDEDRNKHMKYFVENLKEINRINSDKEYSSTSDINMFTDLSQEERGILFGIL